MYNFFLYLHSWLRWIVLICFLISIVRAYSGWLNNKPFTSADNKSSVFLIASVHSQFLIGLLLYFVFSPVTKSAFADFGAAMKNAELRFWAVEHTLMMFIAVVLAQVGRTLSKKASTALAKHKKMAIFYTISLILILASIPWPFMKAMRPLFRF